MLIKLCGILECIVDKFLYSHLCCTKIKINLTFHKNMLLQDTNLGTYLFMSFKNHGYFTMTNNR